MTRGLGHCRIMAAPFPEAIRVSEAESCFDSLSEIDKLRAIRNGVVNQRPLPDKPESLTRRIPRCRI
jgi:hypothetical protein